MVGRTRGRVIARDCVGKAAAAAALGFALALGSAGVASAMPAYNRQVSVEQPDGSTASITTHGDEWFHYATNADGVVVQRDPADGAWRQVVGSGSSLSLGSAAEDAADAGAIGADDLSSTAARKAYYQLAGQTYSGKTASEATTSAPVTVSSIKKTQGTSAKTHALKRPATQTTTSLPLLTIVVGFSDEPYSTSYDWNKSFFTGEYSVSSLYSISSEGKFTWTPASESSAYGVGGNTNVADKANDGVIHVTLDHAYGSPDPFTPGDADYITDMEDAVKAAAQYVDFSAYDTDGDGKVEANELGLGVVFAGYEAATGVIPTGHHGIWSHQYSFTEETGSSYEVTCANGKKVGIDRYIVQSENESISAGEQHQSGIGALGHELGHFLGMPDLYSTTSDSGAWDNYSTMYLSIMDYGSYGQTKSGEYRPTFFDPYDRYLLGFITPEEITKDGTYTATSETDPAGYKCYIIHVSDDEYYLIENRQYESFDAGMEPMYASGDGKIANPTGGIVVWHIDNGIATKCGYGGTGVEAGLANTVNVKTHRPGIMENYFEYSAGSPNLYAPFLNATENTAYGASKLTLYAGSDDPSAKKDTGIKVASTDAGSTKMTFTVDFPLSITKQPESATYKVGDEATALSVELANATGDVTYTWESSTDGGKTWAAARPAAAGGKTSVAARSVADGATLVPDTSHAGTTQYRVTVKDADGTSVTSDVATVKVTSSLKIEVPKDVTYNGKEQRQPVTVRDAKTGEVLTEGTDYELAYSDDVTNAGEVTVTATGMGNYEGDAKASYKIKKATLTVKTESATATYNANGEALTAKGSMTGLVNGETATLNVTGSQKEVGSSKNTATIAWDGTAKESNYDVTYDLGELTVRSADAAVASGSGKAPSAPAGTASSTPAGKATSVVGRAASAIRSVLPKTGDANSAVMPVALGVLGALAVAIGVARRHREHRE
ncbi:LPXTG cell wall anchor domain-containing protein [Parafannyhessea umbonata]|uniref:LPXTG cell wall anchor domain-containing protein n=1 Tax=Parafannyhessea umbonata TaxID=604330 RepID=UPI0026ED85B0|nr:LPXTG cell wall anchor domain-containing protein [Parafannyhessea umbonata]MDD7198451.1 LPXTG cell wall anchor domain-containing protein [Parafannyhessea umbonata]MDY4419306.1 LPXTG cell wall anchor domain-containing protein [Parafannyhessea umbonata]